MLNGISLIVSLLHIYYVHIRGTYKVILEMESACYNSWTDLKKFTWLQYLMLTACHLHASWNTHIFFLIFCMVQEGANASSRLPWAYDNTVLLVIMQWSSCRAVTISEPQYTTTLEHRSANYTQRSAFPLKRQEKPPATSSVWSPNGDWNPDQDKDLRFKSITECLF